MSLGSVPTRLALLGQLALLGLLLVSAGLLLPLHGGDWWPAAPAPGRLGLAIAIAAAWLLATRRNNQGELLLLANEISPNATNLSFEREFGAIIGRLDLIANLLGENSRRIGINYAQGLLLFNFLPVR